MDAFTIPDVKMTLSVYEFALGSEDERGDVADFEQLWNALTRFGWRTRKRS